MAKYSTFFKNSKYKIIEYGKHNKNVKIEKWNIMLNKKSKRKLY